MSDEIIRRIVIYSRVSSEKQVDGFSLDNQRETLTEHAKRMGYEIVEYYEDAGISGKNTKDRPAFTKMISDIRKASKEKEKIDAVFVWKLSRFSRSIADLATNIQKLKKYKCHLVSFKDNVSTVGRMNEAILYVLGVFAEMERENIVDNAKAGMKKGAEQGYWMGGEAGYGYSSARTADNKPTLAINEEEAKYVRLMFDMYADGNGYAKIVDALNNKLNVRTRSGNLFTYFFIQQVLDNPVYNGKIRFGKYEDWNNIERITDTIDEDGKEVKGEKKRKLNKEVIIVEGKHQAIINDDLWNRVRVQRELKSFMPTRIREYHHILSGKVICPVCGTPMVSTMTTRKNKDGTKRDSSYYMCGRYNNTKNCKPNLINRDIVDTKFIELLCTLIDNEKLHELVIEKLNKKVDVSEFKQIIERTEKELIENKRRRDKYKLMFDENDESISGFPDAEIQKNIIDYNKRIYECESLIKLNQLKITVKENESKITSDITFLLQNFKVVFDANNRDLQRDLIKFLVKKIEVTKSENTAERSQIKELTLQFQGEELAYLNMPDSLNFINQNGCTDLDTVHPS